MPEKFQNETARKQKKPEIGALGLRGLLLRNALEIALFAHLRAMINEGKTFPEAYESFISLYQVNEDVLPLATAKTCYYRILKGRM
jgi:hypothetical protein